MKWIKLGDYVEAVIHVLTLGFGHRISLSIAKLFGYNDCKCCERKEWLNKLTDKNYDGGCNEIKLG
jgi:hypothetical protein